MIDFFEIMFFRERMLENNRDEDVCRKCDDLAGEDHTHRMSESEYFHSRQHWWTSLNKSGNTTETLRKRSDLNQAFFYSKPFTPRSWRTTTQADTLLETQRMENGTEFFLHLVGGNGVNPGGLPKNSKKSIKEDACKDLRSNGTTRCLLIFVENLRRTSKHDHVFLLEPNIH